jgi:hypothetical protein
MQQKLIFKTLTVIALLIASTGVMQANAIHGSLPFAGFTVSQNGADLSVSTILSDTASLTSGPGFFDYAVVPMMTDFGPFSLDLTNIATGGGLSLANATFGSFVATTGTIVTQLSSFLDVELFGTYTPGPGMPGVSPGPTELRLGFTQSGVAVSVSGTLTSPPADVPEPGTLALLGSGVIGLAAVLRRKVVS